MAKKKIIDKTIKNKILSFTNLLKRAGIKVDKIILYGSYAKGKPTAYSDIDLCVVSDTFKKSSNEYFKKIWQLAMKVDPSLEPIPFTSGELANKYSTLSAEINQFGVRIV